jgi:hypothetical protein
MQKNNPKEFTGKKKIILIISLIALIAIPIILYLVFREKESDQWYSSDWNFRRSIVVENDSNTRILEEEILVEIDTQSLIEDEKMQNDCDDLRFLDSDNETNLDFWIEGGCNTQSTQVWVMIPSLPKDGKIIYAYYGNEKAPNSEIQWSGEFIMFSDSTDCSDGWEKATEYNNKFLYGSETSGEELGSNTHDHGGLALTSSQIEVSTCKEGCTDNLYINKVSDLYALNISEEENIPPYTTLLACKSDDLSFTNQISYFDTTDLTDEWTDINEIEGKFVMISSVAYLTGGREDHSHNILENTSNILYQYSNYLGNGSKEESEAEGLFETYIDSTSNIPSYEVLYLAKSSSELSVGEDNMIIPTTELPPLGWTYYSELENKIPMVGSNIGDTGGNNYHSHHITSVLSSSNLGSISQKESLNMTFLDISMEEASNIPESISVIYAKRKNSTKLSIKEEETNPEKETIASYTGINGDSSTSGGDINTDVKGASTSAPTNLLTEGSTNPTKVVDTTPEFSAIFTDPDTGDTGEYYQIQVNTTTDFSSDAIVDTYDFSNISSVGSIYDTNNGPLAQTFTGDGGTLDYVQFSMAKIGSPTGIVYCKIYAITGTYGTDSKPTGAALATANIRYASEFSLTQTTETFVFSGANKITLVDGTHYAVSVEYTTGDSLNKIRLYSDNTSPSHDGNYAYLSGSSWIGSNYLDIPFIVYKDHFGVTMWDSTQTGLVTPLTSGSRSPDISYAGTTLEWATNILLENKILG